MKSGITPTAVTFGKGWIAVVRGDSQILIFDKASGDLRHTIEIE